MNLDEKYQEQAAYDMGYNSALNYEPLASLQDYDLYVSSDKYYPNYKQGHEDGVKDLKISSIQLDTTHP